MTDRTATLGAMWSMAVGTLVMIAAWFTHVIVCIQDERWFFLIAGAIAGPIGIVHGIGVWFGLF